MTTMMNAPLGAASSPSGGSRLAQMQARFQQRQVQEKEQKLLQLYENQTQRAFRRVGRGSAGSSSSSVSSTSSSLGAGKVRQLFQDRRHQSGSKTGGSGPTGWDRSYPLEPLESTASKQRLQASKSITNLKGARGMIQERNYQNGIATSSQQQDKNLVRRSKSQVRSSSYAVSDLGRNFRQLSLSQQKLYGEDDYDVTDLPRNHNPRIYQDEQNNRIGLEREHRDSEIFHKQRIYDTYEDEDYVIDHEEPPFRQLDDDVDDFNDSSHVFQKLPNVGGRLLIESKMNNNNNNNNNNNVNRYKTYNATHNGIRDARMNMTDRGDNSRKTTLPAEREVTQRRRDSEDAVPVTKHRASVATKNPDIKLTSHLSAAKESSLPKSNSTPRKLEFENLKASPETDSTSMLFKKKKTPSPTQSTRQTPERAAPTRATATRGPPATNVNQKLSKCRVCGRQFASDRVATHQEICSRTMKKTRKVFDPVRHRVKGTEAEAYLRKGRPKASPAKKKSNWRQKHEEFIATIRAAKGMKEHLARGGKVSDLPPPPPSDYSDYIQCPHCSRRFNQDAAERHIPKCATYAFNKPRPPQGGRGTPTRGAGPSYGGAGPSYGGAGPSYRGAGPYRGAVPRRRF